MKKGICNLLIVLVLGTMFIWGCKKDSTTDSTTTTPTTNNNDVSTGEGIIFNPNCTYGTMKDSRDNKVYKTIKIGTQTWMAQNLDYVASSGSWCYLDNVNNCKVYGRLYDWKTAMQGAASSNNNPSGVKGICPTGWHFPSNTEWLTLSTYLGGDAGLKMKETDNKHWNSPNLADNSSGFTALPGGEYFISNNIIMGYSGISIYGSWWTSNASINSHFQTLWGYQCSMDNNSTIVNFGSTDTATRYSVRCVKD